MKNIYLDIDGTLLLDDLKNSGRGALGLAFFLVYLGNLQARGVCRVNWLTTHCKDGSAGAALDYLRSKIDPHDYNLIERMEILPTRWNELKTEAIDFSEDFLWLDDDVSLKEREVLRTNGASHKLIEVDLGKDKYQLKTIVNSRVLEF